MASDEGWQAQVNSAALSSSGDMIIMIACQVSAQMIQLYCTDHVCGLLVQIDGLMVVPLEAAIVACHICAQRLVPPECRARAHRNLLLLLQLREATERCSDIDDDMKRAHIKDFLMHESAKGAHRKVEPLPGLP